MKVARSLVCAALVACGHDASVGTNDQSAALEDLALASDARAAVGARDWAAAPAIAQIDTDADVYAVGDVHGDYATVVSLLVGAKILNGEPSAPSAPVWTAGNAVLVCTGDLIDKGPRSLDVIALFEALADAASQAGGRVVVTAGNHEAEFLAAPDPARDFDQELVAAGLSPADVAAGLVAPGPYLRGLPFAARVNDWFFVHAGNTQGRSLDELDASLRAGIDSSGWSAPILSAGDSMLEARLSKDAAPWWGKPSTALSTIATYASSVGATHLVMGHQPGAFVMPDGSQRTQDALVQAGHIIYFIDVGMSVGVDDSKGPLLHIHREGTTVTVETISPSGKTTPL